jgi:hypothetical protein
MRAGRRRVLCSPTVHCDETTTSSVSPTCCRASADRGRLSWRHRVGDGGSGAWGCGWKYGMRDCGRHWGGRVVLRGQRPAGVEPFFLIVLPYPPLRFFGTNSHNTHIWVFSRETYFCETVLKINRTYNPLVAVDSREHWTAWQLQ